MARHLESADQRRLMIWWRFAHRGLGISAEPLLYAVPNGGSRHRIEACRLKGEGVRAGIPDLHLAVARGRYHGLYIEMKSLTGRPSPEQREILAQLEAQGYAVAIPNGFDQAVGVIEAYVRDAICEPLAYWLVTPSKRLQTLRLLKA